MHDTESGRGSRSAAAPYRPHAILTWSVGEGTDHFACVTVKATPERCLDVARALWLTGGCNVILLGYIDSDLAEVRWSWESVGNGRAA